MPQDDYQLPGDTTFLTGALDYRRIAGRVLQLPDYEFTKEHADAAAEIGTRDGLLRGLRSDGPTILGLIVGVFIFRWLVTKILIKPVAEYYIPINSEQQPKDRAKAISKFVCSGWEAVFYTLSASFGLFVLAQEEWTIWPSTNFWVDWPLQPFSPLFQSYYLVGLAFYTQALLSLLLLDEPRSDYVEYLLHHLVTVFLIAASFYTRIQRYGLIILLLHDIGDVFMNWAKVFKYMGPAWDTPCTVSFITFAVLFFLTRLVFLPLTVIPSGYWEAMQLGYDSAGVHIVPGFSAMNVALVILQLLHVFWFYLVLKVVKKFLRGNLDDVREDGDKKKK